MVLCNIVFTVQSNPCFPLIHTHLFTSISNSFYRFVPAHILLCVGMTGLPITMFLIPACRVLAALLINLMVMGWFMGSVDCVANLRMILRFGTNVTPFLQV